MVAIFIYLKRFIHVFRIREVNYLWDIVFTIFVTNKQLPFMKTKLLLGFAILMAMQIKAQQDLPYCGSDKVNSELMDKDPSFKKRVDDFNMKLATQNLTSKVIGSGTNIMYEIPVVIHVMNDGGAIGTAYNKSDAELIAWINNCNAIYEGTALGYVGPGAGGTKIPIRFALAKRDPSCKPTTGIVRVNASISYPDYTTMELNILIHLPQLQHMI